MRSNAASIKLGVHMNCAHCGTRLALSVVISPVGPIRCRQCKQTSQRFFSSGRIAAVFAALWALMGVMYLIRGQLGEWRFFLPLLVIYAAVNGAIAVSAPLRMKADSDSRTNQWWRAAVFLGLFLLTMVGIKWIRSVLEEPSVARLTPISTPNNTMPQDMPPATPAPQVGSPPSPTTKVFSPVADTSITVPHIHRGGGDSHENRK